MTINERIRDFRKNELKCTQQDFAIEIMISRSNLGNIETGAVEVTDRVISSICSRFNLNENWLRYGEAPIYKEADTFDLNEFVKSKGASDLELDILKAYFELDPEIRRTVIEHFSCHFGRKDIEV